MTSKFCINIEIEHFHSKILIYVSVSVGDDKFVFQLWDL